METIIAALWPHLLTAILPAIGLYVGYIHKLKVDVAVMQKTIEGQQKNIDNMTARLDKHSRKQDEIFDTLTEIKVEIAKQMGTIGANIGSLASDVKNLNSLLMVSDKGVTINKQ